MKVLFILCLSWLPLIAQQPVAAANVAVAEPAHAVVFGESFAIRIAHAGELQAAQLLPLVVESLVRSPANDGSWQCRARCYELGEVVLSVTPPVRLTVRSSLPEPAGEMEWPGDGWRLSPPPGSWWLRYGLLALAGLFVVAWWRFFRRVEVPVTRALLVKEPPWDALSALRELSPNDPEHDTYYQQVKALVRRHCAVRFHLPAEMRTSEELLALLPRAAATLQPCLSSCDGVLFGGGQRTAATAQFVQQHAVAFIESTRLAIAVVGSES